MGVTSRYVLTARSPIASQTAWGNFFASRGDSIIASCRICSKICRGMGGCGRQSSTMIESRKDL